MKKRFLLSVVALAGLVFQASGDITAAQGWLETFYVAWTGGAGSSVYYRAAGASSWTQVDAELIRDYKNYYRADVLGISAGTYEVEVRPSSGAAMSRTNIQVLAHDRSGFAFLGGVVPGAYNANGTLKTGAQVIYVTNANKDNVTFSVKTAANGTMTSSAGLQAIFKSIEKGYEDRPLAFRFIGRITDEDFTLTEGGGDIVIKDNCKNITNSYITFEGVGNDATFYGWSVRTTRATNIEIRNLGLMLTNSTGGDGIEINTDSKHIWIHNNDTFYGNPGSASDQVKGDGAHDVKLSTNITISYNHYWDSGKTNLFGNSTSEPPGSITLHHNWYDHSDSRHPRVRVHNVHVYNNYYDGIPTYGIGAAHRSSIFAERNYFRNATRPMTIANQGSDNGTFGDEDGGIIKAFSNFLDNASRSKYTPYSSSVTVEFDAYEVSSATATVPSSVSAKKGGTTYNNNLIPSNYPSYTTQNDSAAVRTQVTRYAGRYWGGDFKFTFTSSDDADHAVNAALKTALQNYKSGLEIGGAPPTGTKRPASAPRQNAAGSYLVAGKNTVSLYVADNANTTVEIFDLKGSVVRAATFRQGGYHAVSLGNLPRGMYVVRAKNDVWQKTVKMHTVK